LFYIQRHPRICSSASHLASTGNYHSRLEECPDYVLVLCRHYLGGGVTALLAILLSETSPTGASFVTVFYSQPSPQLLLTASTSDHSAAPAQHLSLPPRKPIHVYAYGSLLFPPPCNSRSNNNHRQCARSGPVLLVQYLSQSPSCRTGIQNRRFRSQG
jgi:hypothetical protein